MEKPLTLVDRVIKEVRSGLISSVIAEAALFPLDTVKLLQQVHGGSAAKVFRGVLQEHGPLGLYQGLIGRCIQTITSNVGFFMWQTVLMQLARRQRELGCGGAGERQPRQLSTGISLIVNMLAQQANRIITTPVDVVANVNQADPASRGFFHTFVRLARTGGRATLWRGLGLALLLSLNPALMFTLVDKLSSFVSACKGSSGPLTATDMFFVSGISKAIATLVFYPLIRAKAVAQTMGADGGIWRTLTDILRNEGAAGLYKGVWMLSYKTVLFNSLMMSLKQKVNSLLDKEDDKGSVVRRISDWMSEGGSLRQKVTLAGARELPWLASKKTTVVYVDGSWAFFHEAQQYLLQQAAQHGDYLLVGVHSDECLHDIFGEYPAECYAQRVARIRRNKLVSAILEEAPWEATEELVRQMGVSKVLAGSISKLEDCSPRGSGRTRTQAEEASSQAYANPQEAVDPYKDCRRLGIFEEIESLNKDTERDIWLSQVRKLFFSNVDASIDWRILVDDGKRAPFGQNPGYKDDSCLPPRASSMRIARVTSDPSMSPGRHQLLPKSISTPIGS